MEFRTPVSITPSPDKIRLDSPLLSIGSCFSYCIGNRLRDNKFKVLVNPFGTVFNPLSIFRLLQYAVTGDTPPDFTYVKNQEIWRNLDFHSDFYALGKADLAAQIIRKINEVRELLPQLQFLLITPGTALIYETEEEEYLVSNCQKLPSTYFRPKRLLAIEEIVAGFDLLQGNLKTINPDLKYIFTVSPVRHTKDTLELNAISKATLLVAVRQLKEKYQAVDYFPSYEIMIDDLRDYRFYEADMIHPNEVAEAYIWSKFSTRYFDETTTNLLGKWQKIKQAIAHKPFQPDSSTYHSFIKKTIERLEELKETIDVSKEIAALKAKLK